MRKNRCVVAQAMAKRAAVGLRAATQVAGIKKENRRTVVGNEQLSAPRKVNVMGERLLTLLRHRFNILATVYTTDRECYPPPPLQSFVLYCISVKCTVGHLPPYNGLVQTSLLPGATSTINVNNTSTMLSVAPAFSLLPAARLLLTIAVVLSVSDRKVLKEKWKMLVHGPVFEEVWRKGRGGN